MSENIQPTLLVTGASGHFGRLAIGFLLEAGVRPEKIIGTTRSPEKLADFAARGVIVRHADFDQPESLADAFAGADRLLLISTDVLGVPGKRIQQHQNAVQAAEDAGVQHVVYTSIVKAAADSPVGVAPDHYATEAALRESGMGWTLLRNSIYTEMLIPTLAQAVQAGQFSNASGEGKTTYITREDCAHAAAAALASDYEGQRVLDITGPEALSQAEIASIASSITGSPITYVPIDAETLINGMTGFGLPRPLAEIYASFDVGASLGLFEEVSSDFEALTGRPATSLREFLSASRDALVQGGSE